MNEFLFVILKTIGIYILILVCLRLLGKKGIAELSAADLVLIIIIGEGISTMIPQETGFGGVVIYVIALSAANYGIEYWAFKSKKFNKILEGEPVILIRKGKMMKRNMDKERVTLENLKEALRTKGVSHVDEVDLAILETDGEISVIPVKSMVTESSEKN
ncbi:MAG TPA: YetF domain-containing protein [Ignavibacteria bacterium]|nr:YetF domain-containing protein [Ignavibacteria bacterium]